MSAPIADGEQVCVGGTRVRVRYDPDLVIDSEPRWGALLHHTTEHPEIVLRQWDERVFLHELLHLLLDRHVPAGHRTYDGTWVEHPEHEKAVREIEDGLWDMGWRLFDGVTHIDPTKPRIPSESPRVRGESRTHE
jgi:hypothetical protein